MTYTISGYARTVYTLSGVNPSPTITYVSGTDFSRVKIENFDLQSYTKAQILDLIGMIDVIIGTMPEALDPVPES